MKEVDIQQFADWLEDISVSLSEIARGIEKSNEVSEKFLDSYRQANGISRQD